MYFSFAPVKHRPTLFCKHSVNERGLNSFVLDNVEIVQQSELLLLHNHLLQIPSRYKRL